MKKIENNFTVTGYIATDAEIHQFAESTKATFALSIGRRENKNGQEVWSSVLANVELWRKNSSAQDLENLKKGRLVTVEGYFRPEQWTGKDGEQHSRLLLAANKVYETPEKEQDEEPAPEENKDAAPEKASKKTGKKGK